MTTNDRISIAGRVLAMTVCLQLGAATVAAQQLTCPQSINTTQQLANAPSGWDAVREPGTHALASITIFDDPPQDKASLVYDALNESRTERTAVWKLAANSRGYWLSCSYDRTAVALTRRLPATVKECQVVYDKWTSSGGLPAIKSMKCQ